MKTVFKGKRISGLLGIVPEMEYCFDDEVYNFDEPVKQSMRLKKVMGYDRHRLVKPKTNTSDLCIYGLKYLLDHHMIRKEEIGAVLVVTVSPDYFIPHVSNIIHGEFQLGQEVLCMDIAQGCAGFLMGVMEACFLLNSLGDKKVLLFNADVLGRDGDRKHRDTYPLSGDAAGITVVENDATAEDIYFSIYTDGGNRNALLIGGAFKTLGSQEIPGMNGSEVFNFVQREVPPLVDEILKYSGLSKDDIDYYIFHQPNKFMLEKLANKMQVPYEKMFMNVVGKYGNSSGATIPIAITDNLGGVITDKRFRCCLSGFGEGLTWSAMTAVLEKLDFCEIIVSDC